MIITNMNYTEIINEAIRILDLDASEFSNLSDKFETDPDISEQAKVLFKALAKYNKTAKQEVVHVCMKAKVPPVEGDMYNGDPIILDEQEYEVVNG